MNNKKTKIICTIGPSSENIDVIRKLSLNGMNVARLNFSHGSYEEHSKKIETIKKLRKEGLPISILLDTKGPEIRVGELENNFVDLKEDDTIKISMTPIIGNNKIISVSYQKLYEDVKVGSLLRIDDGKLTLKVNSIEKSGDIIATILNSHTLLPHKSVVVPFTCLKMNYISEKDKNDLIFGCINDVDYVAASFTRNKQDVVDIRKVLDENGGQRIKIIAKIENQEGYENIDDILSVADGVMVARGDLGVEVNIEDVPIIQKELIRKAHQLGKIVIVATQMLDSMQYSMMPTRAEVIDVANAVYEGVDAIMLSGETASGKYPLEACGMQNKISQRIEGVLDYEKNIDKLDRNLNCNSIESNAYLFVKDAIKSNVKLIVSFTNTGKLSEKIASFRPHCPIISISENENVKYSLSLYYGVNGTCLNFDCSSIDSLRSISVKLAKEYGLEKGNKISFITDNYLGNIFSEIITLK